MKSNYRLLIKSIFLPLVLSAPILAAAQVTLHYNERPPYQVNDKGQLVGLVGSPTMAAFKAAGIAFTLAETPWLRQIDVIKENKGADCGVNWFKNEEREVFAKFTKPVYQDKPQIALTAATNIKLKGDQTVETVLGNRGLTILVKQGYSYGPSLDAMMETLKTNKLTVTGESLQMLQMILSERADYMFIAPEEADGLIASAGVDSATVRKVSFSNAPKGEYRHIACSKKVPDEVIAKLNKAIK